MAKMPCAMTTGTGKCRSGGTATWLPARCTAGEPAAAIAIAARGAGFDRGALCSWYTPTQRTAMVRPSATTATRISAAIQVRPDRPVIRK
jgi:hypothetical protein